MNESDLYPINPARGVLIIFLLIWVCVIPVTSNTTISPPGVVLISWDGVHLDDLDDLLTAGKLGNLSNLINVGSRTNIKITDHYADTMAGHAEMLTGYPPDLTGVFNNLHYSEIPAGYTIFERLNGHQINGTNIMTVMVVSKEHNLGVDSGLPFANAGKILDYYHAENKDADVTSLQAVQALEKYVSQSPFFIFIHFRDADEAGHLFTGGSEEYRNGIINDDAGTGVVLNTLDFMGITNNTCVFITTDHGFNSGRRTHHGDTDLWLVSSEKLLQKEGDQKDIVPSILNYFGIQESFTSLSDQGVSLLEKNGDIYFNKSETGITRKHTGEE
jgi:predicted AlkP superfamily pyrophosphatase or phosphodiesterase